MKFYKLCTMFYNAICNYLGTIYAKIVIIVFHFTVISCYGFTKDAVQEVDIKFMTKYCIYSVQILNTV